jgi:hypothetical protein
VKLCFDPRHGEDTPCFPDTCMACQEECDPLYWVEVELKCPHCGKDLSDWIIKGETLVEHLKTSFLNKGGEFGISQKDSAKNAANNETLCEDPQ